MPLIDLNSTLGESFGPWKMGLDETMLRIATSATIACGLHAGDPLVMQTTAGSARRAAIGVGAQPGYPDLQGFGRREISMKPYEIYAYTLYQIGALQAICRANNVRLEYVKPHGALYERGSKDLPVAKSVACAVRDADRNLILVGHADSHFKAAAEEANIMFAAEVFADRGYNDDGTPIPRGERGDVLNDPQLAAARMLKLIKEGVLETASGKTIPMQVQSIGVHGDFPAAAHIAHAVRQTLEANGVTFARLRKVLEPQEKPQDS